MLLTLTNPVENITRVTLAACEEEDPDDINSTSQVFHYSVSFICAEKLCPDELNQLSRVVQRKYLKM